MSETHEITVETSSPEIIVLKLNRPERLNALTRQTVHAFNAALDEIAQDKAVRVVILTGAGRGFCAGQDLQAAAERSKSGVSGVTEKLYWQEQFSGMVRRIRALPVPVIAAVNGPAAGAGCALALGADIRIAALSAKFLIASIKIGLSAGETGISYHLPRLVGASRAFEIMLTGRTISAVEAERIGLVSRLVEDPELMDAAMATAQAILANSPFAVAETKRLMWANLDAGGLDEALALENRAQILATMTEDYKEATIAFTEKRLPKFQGK
jgi:enoyl-CoA hydratase